MAGVRNGNMAVSNPPPVGNRSTQRKLVLSMVGNVILMLILVFCLTFGGFLFMDYKTEEARAKKMDRRVVELRKQFEQGCEK
jgi:hypothetical protein